jgi:CheY-like chemotaxis protein
MAVVLVVNDDHDMLDAYEALITQLGHEVVTEVSVESGPEAVRAVGADALVVDLQQADQEAYGLRLIEEVRADPEVRNIPIILSSGASEHVAALRPRLEELNVAVLHKPFRVTDLEETLAVILRRG